MRIKLILTAVIYLSALNGAFSQNRALDLYNTNGQVYCYTAFNPTLSGAGTFEAWIYLTSTPGNNNRIFSSGASYIYYDEVYLTSGVGKIKTTGSFVVGDNIESTSALPVGEWVHVAITANSTESKLYINGELDDTGGAAALSIANFRFGGQWTESYENLDGKIDEVRVWTDVRTQQEIQDNMYRALDVSTASNLLAYYPLDETTGSTAYDIAGHANGPYNGTLDAGISFNVNSVYENWCPIYVNDNASGSGTGDNWTDAYTSLQTALNEATNSLADIWVAAGTYKPSYDYGLNLPSPNTARGYHFRMIDEVAIYGGFAGTETAVSERDIAANESILSGDIGNANNNSDNCYHLFYHPDEYVLTTAAVLNGFTIKDGNANGTSSHSYGGGMLNYNSSATIINCIFTANSANSSAAIHCEISDLTIINSVVFKNIASSGAGGLYLWYGNHNIYNCTFNKNSTGNGVGGIYAQGGSILSLTNSIIWGNICVTGSRNMKEDYGSSITSQYCDIQGSGGSDDWNTNFGTDGGNNIDSKPKFAGLVHDYPYALAGTSPCINAGTNTGVTEVNDIRGTSFSRTQNSTTDMGAYEYTSGTDPAISTTTWTGASNSIFFYDVNWDFDVPTETDDVQIPDVTNNPSFYSKEACRNLTVDAGASLTLSSGASLIVNGTASGNVTVQRYVDANTKADKWHYVSAPVSGQALNSAWMTANSITNTPHYQFFRWDEDSNYWIYFGYTGTEPENFGDATFVNARGYCINRSSAGTLSFTGTVRTSDVTYAATYTADQGEGFNLVGNPFTASIGITSNATSSTNFISENTALLHNSYEAIYIWDEAADYTWGSQDYKIISNAAIGSYSRIDQDCVQPGQAFFVKVVSNGNLSFKESMQVHDDGDYYKNPKESWPSVELIIENGTLFNTTAIGFHENMTKGLDPSCDVAKMKGNPNIALYTRLLDDNGHDFAIQALPDDNIEELVIPVGVDVSETQILNFSAQQEKLDDYSIILEDRQENTFTDLRWETYTTEIKNKGTGRFYLHFKDATGMGENPYNPGIRVFAANGNMFIKGVNSGNVTLSDLTGRVIMQQEFSGEATISIPVNLQTGVYLVTVQSGQEIKTEKVIIK